MAMAAWAGLLATAINLLPMGQLDGGHILYAAFGPRLHRVLSTVFVAVLVLLGFAYWPWWVWAVMMFFFGRRHPLVYDETPLDGYRVVVSIVALLALPAFHLDRAGVREDRSHADQNLRGDYHFQ